LDGRLDLVLDLGADRLDVDAEPLQPPGLAVDRILRASLLDLLLGHVLHVVVRRMAVHAHRDGLEHGRAVRPSTSCLITKRSWRDT
jgi:hypothetical protein